MKHHFRIDGASHRAWLVKRARDYALIDDATTSVSALPLQDGHVCVYVGAHVYDALIAVDSDRAFIHVDGREYEIAYESATAVFEHEAQASGDAIARAPMPGAVVATPVSVGQNVAEGDVLVVIESMKLETSITAPRSGVVETLHVAIGQTFERDAPLVTLAPLPEA